MQYQLLTKEERESIISKFKNLYKTDLGHFAKEKKTIFKYVTARIIDTLKLFFQEDVFMEIYDTKPFSNIRIANTLAESVKDVPGIVVEIGSGDFEINEFGISFLNEDENKESIETADLDITLSVQGSNKIQCEEISGILTKGFKTFLRPALASYSPRIVANSSFSISAVSNEEITAEFRYAERSVTFSVNVDHLSTEWIIDEDEFEEADIG